MRAYRTGNPHADDGRANPYRELLAEGPPSTRPDGAGSSSLPFPDSSGRQKTTDDVGPGPSPDGVRGQAVPAAADPQAALGPRRDVTVVLPGELPPRRSPMAPVRSHGRRGGTSATRRAAGRSAGPASSRRRRPRRFGRYYRFAVWLILGLGIGGAFLTGVALDRLGAWDHEVPLQEDAALSFPRSEERWIWLPEDRMGDIVCTGTDGGGANLPMRPALGYDHDDYSSAYRFPTGDGEVTLRCDAAPSPATAGWTPDGTEMVRVAEPVDRAGDVPVLQAALIVTLGGPALGAVVLVGTLLAHIGTGVADLVANVRAKQERKRRREQDASRRTLQG